MDGRGTIGAERQGIDGMQFACARSLNTRDTAMECAIPPSAALQEEAALGRVGPEVGHLKETVGEVSPQVKCIFSAKIGDAAARERPQPSRTQHMLARATRGESRARTR
eukprot:6019389-Pleurochrysis_carterae.AAC.1